MISDIEHEASFDNSHLSRRTRSKFLAHPTLKFSLDISTTLELQQTPHKECRICLQTDDSQSNPFVAPCKCTGSVKYVHEQCYRKWIERQYCNNGKRQQLAMLEKGAVCELCKERISLEFKYCLSCTTWEIFCNKFSKNSPMFILFLLFVLGNSACLAYLSFYASQNPSSLRNSLTSLVMVIASFVFLGITLLVTSYYFVSDFFVGRVWRLESFGRERRRKGNQNQVHPLVSVEEMPQ